MILSLVLVRESVKSRPTSLRGDCWRLGFGSEVVEDQLIGLIRIGDDFNTSADPLIGG